MTIKLYIYTVKAPKEEEYSLVHTQWIILIFGWGNSISKDVLGLHHQLEAARQALASAHAELDAQLTALQHM